MELKVKLSNLEIYFCSLANSKTFFSISLFLNGPLKSKTSINSMNVNPVNEEIDIVSNFQHKFLMKIPNVTF